MTLANRLSNEIDDWYCVILRKLRETSWQESTIFPRYHYFLRGHYRNHVPGISVAVAKVLRNAVQYRACTF